IFQEAVHKPVSAVDEPGKEFAPLASKNVLVQKNEFPGKDFQDEGLGRAPVFAMALIAADHHKLADGPVQQRLQGAEELQLDKINSAGLVEAVRNFDSARPQVEASLKAGGENDVVVSGLELQPIAARLAAEIPFGL